MISQRLGHYEIERELARGGMATVYLARESGSGRVVVIKTLPSQFLHDPRFRDRFQREAQVITRLKHPAIVPVYGYGEDKDTPYLAMAYMIGGTLADRIRSGPMGVDAAVAILRPIASALDYAHSQGVVHV